MSVELFKNLLATFKRSNKDRKQNLAKKAGFDTADDYKKYLESQISLEPAKDVIPAKDVKTPKVEENLTDMVIAFDTTGSMSSYIGAVKNHVTQLIPELFKQNPGLNISVVAFGDYCDMESSSKFGKAYQVISLTNNENDLITFVQNAKGTAGGDGDEFYELVIQKITKETNWREGSNKSVLFIGDADPHKKGHEYRRGYPKSPDWREEAQKAASQGIIFDTLRIHGNAWYQELADITGGVCLPFSSSSKTAKLVEATALARGGESTKMAFMEKSTSSEVTSDAAMNSVYSMYSKEVVNKK